MNKYYDVIVSGYPSLDRIIKVSDNPTFGITSLIHNKDNAQVHYGGCSTNIVYLASKLGIKALPIFRVGCDFEKVGLKNFLEEGQVPLEGIRVIENDYTSNCYLIENKDGNHITLFYPGAMDSKYYKKLDQSIFSKSKYAVITVGCLEENWDFMKCAKKAGNKIVAGMKCDFNAFPFEFLKELLYGSHIIFANEGERKEIESKFDLESIDELFKDGSAEVVIITKGSDGSEVYYLEDGKIKKENINIAVPDKIIDTTGVGDAYITGFLYGLTKEKSYIECAKYGAVASSFIIEDMGCLGRIPTIKEYEERYKKNYIGK
ncbi:carbohydrate kinase family protein [Clostridium fallax]|uniref:Adenosine kinase n=1 Tax=Clostridium fallax TaxID=1533 RepID=A0A1M4V8Y7_9CLOT|nr:carbohydrate kinase family protein [Clostridium fallax]SHE65333.1 adenosine kinase [Clostridium fallax]SQB05842.1 sugar kinase [Clostridium fallax]